MARSILLSLNWNYKEKTITAKALFSSLSRDGDKAFAVIVYHV